MFAQSAHLNQTKLFTVCFYSSFNSFFIQKINETFSLAMHVFAKRTRSIVLPIRSPRSLWPPSPFALS